MANEKSVKEILYIIKSRDVKSAKPMIQELIRSGKLKKTSDFSEAHAGKHEKHTKK